SEKKPLLFLIDEIFRGTNSKDRTDGALTVLKRLSSQEICGLMTTHDYALCNSTLNIMQNVVYYHFAETYNDNEIFFDYLLSDGVSKNSNAQFLMKMVGIE
ncbi:MAG TPA: MutS family DNA mismatch repair protein, partial [Saccharofermentans sp.]|nr:MutS family DNA mismatch repair protein [Saccharofermentans sp.]